jgi:glycosyltransferase involved in cell wall biosynthesis
MERKKILWLVSWYPNKNDPFNGDFIQRHARAAAINDDIHVLFITKSSKAETHEDLQFTTGLTEQIIYFKEYKSFLGKVQNKISYLTLYKIAVQSYIKKNGLPHCVHVHIPWKAGLVALWIKKLYEVPYVITEHWGIYNKVEKYNFSQRSLLNKKALKYIIDESQILLSVSKFLGDGINKMVTKKEFVIIPNVVDTVLFHLSEKAQNAPFTFIHVSNGVAIKNIVGIIKGFSTYYKKSIEYNDRLLIVGPKHKEYKAAAEAFGLLNKNIFFIGEVPYTEVAQQMREANALILFSHMENSPCVIGEAMCCGLPVVASNVGGIPELINDSNGVLVKEGDTKNLAEALEFVKTNYSIFNRKLISENATRKYNYGEIGRQFHSIYNSIVPST